MSKEFVFRVLDELRKVIQSSEILSSPISRRRERRAIIYIGLSYSLPSSAVMLRDMCCVIHDFSGREQQVAGTRQQEELKMLDTLSPKAAEMKVGDLVVTVVGASTSLRVIDPDKLQIRTIASLEQTAFPEFGHVIFAQFEDGGDDPASQYVLATDRWNLLEKMIPMLVEEQARLKVALNK
jgi:hypothetical protein